jgi:CheY-like chemotaxis protein
MSDPPAVSDVRLLLIDLTLPEVNVGDVVAKARQRFPKLATIVAFGPHVNQDSLESARQARCDTVVTRGELHSRLAEILAQATDDDLTATAAR